MNYIRCNICNGKTKKKLVKTRSKKNLQINLCKKCDYEFFLNEKTKNLKQNKLDKFRLKSAGLKLVNKNRDFINGLKQSETYIKNYLPNKKKCWYFVMDIRDPITNKSKITRPDILGTYLFDQRIEGLVMVFKSKRNRDAIQKYVMRGI